MLDDLTPKEICLIIIALKNLPDESMIMNDRNEMTFMRNLPELRSLMDKINRCEETRDDLKRYINEKYR